MMKFITKICYMVFLLGYLYLIGWASASGNGLRIGNTIDRAIGGSNILSTEFKTDRSLQQ